MDLRERILKDCDAGMGTRAVATKYSVSESWVRRLKQRRRETGETAPRATGSKKPPGWVAFADELRNLVERQPDATLEELRQQLGNRCSTRTLARALVALRLTFKKKSSTPRNRIVRTFKPGGPPGKPR
jgi:transposase